MGTGMMTDGRSLRAGLGGAEALEPPSRLHPSDAIPNALRKVTLGVTLVERLVEIADRAGVKQGIDVVGPHDTVMVEFARNACAKARGDA